MNNRSQSLLSQFSNQQLQQLRRAPTLEEKEQLIIKYKRENAQAQGEASILKPLPNALAIKT